MQRSTRLIKSLFFFFLGAGLMSLILVSAAYIFLSLYFQHRIYPGVKINNINVSEKTTDELKTFFAYSNHQQIDNLTILIDSPQATISATAVEIGLNLDTNLMVQRAFSIGRQTNNPYYNLLQIISAQKGNINLPLEVSFDQAAINKKFDSIAPQIEKTPVNAIYKFNPGTGPDGKGRVEAFSPSFPGLAIDRTKILEEIILETKSYLKIGLTPASNLITVPLHTKEVPPEIQSSTADDMGINDLIGHGESFFYDSIPGRVYNIKLGTEKVSGSLIAPGEVFSFGDSIGTVSAVFGFQKAYSIIKGKTVLDDGGGVCQVSTTIYRAVLNAGLPIVERAAHAYRVGFYEQGGFLPGMDATVYPPSPDFRFKNDTGNWILLQATFDAPNHKLSFDVFGTNDGRKTQIQGPFIISTSPPPEPITEDDPTKPLGTITQVDNAHNGAKVYFKRTVIRGSETLIDETVTSNYVPWPARYLRGTKT